MSFSKRNVLIFSVSQVCSVEIRHSCGVSCCASKVFNVVCFVGFFFSPRPWKICKASVFMSPRHPTPDTSGQKKKNYIIITFNSIGSMNHACIVQHRFTREPDRHQSCIKFSTYINIAMIVVQSVWCLSKKPTNLVSSDHEKKKDKRYWI